MHDHLKHTGTTEMQPMCELLPKCIRVLHACQHSQVCDSIMCFSHAQPAAISQFYIAPMHNPQKSMAAQPHSKVLYTHTTQIAVCTTYRLSSRKHVGTSPPSIHTSTCAHHASTQQNVSTGNTKTASRQYRYRVDAQK